MWVLEILEILARRRRFVIGNTLLVTILAIGISFVLPKTYRAKTTVLPPESESPLSGLMGLSSGHVAMAVTNFALPLMATPSDLYASMMESETILNKVVDSLDLQRIYKSESSWSAITSLRSDLLVKVEPDGIISVEVDARDKFLSASIANLIVSSLDDLNRELQNQKGKNYSKFLERRLRDTDSALASASNELRVFQETNRAISLEFQSEALINNLANQKARLTSAEFELEVLRKTVYSDHPELKRMEMRVIEMRKSLREIENGARTPQDSVLSALDIPLARVPDLTLQFAILKRNVKIQETTFELLSQQFEMARLQEHRDTPTIVRLDIARPPELPIKPQKKMIAIAAFVLSFLASSLFVVAGHKVSQATSKGSSVLVKLHNLFVDIKSRPLG